MIPTSVVADPKVPASLGAGTRDNPNAGPGDPADGLAESLSTWLNAHGAVEGLHQFQHLASEVFPPDTTYAFALEADPDAGDESVVCVATLPDAQPVHALACYDQFVARWARLPDPRVGGLFTLLVRSVPQ